MWSDSDILYTRFFHSACIDTMRFLIQFFILLLQLWSVSLLSACNVKEPAVKKTAPENIPVVRTSSASVSAAVVKPNAIKTDVLSCGKQQAQSLKVVPFYDSFDKPNWGERYDWGYNADKKRYPPLDSMPFDGIGDTRKQPHKTRHRVHRSVNTPAISITSGKHEGVPQRAGNMVKFTLRPGDVASDRNRAELQLFKNQDPMCSEAWYGWSVYIPEDFDGATATKGFFTVGQWHAQRDKRSTDPRMKFRYQNPVSIAYVPATHKGKGRRDSDMLIINTKVKNQRTGKITSKVIASYNIKRGHWVDIVVHLKWSMASDGFIEAWMRSLPATALVTNELPAYDPVVFNNYKTRFYGVTAGNSLGNFFKLGLYRKKNVNDATTGIIYYDEFRRGNSFADVALEPKAIH